MFRRARLVLSMTLSMGLIATATATAAVAGQDRTPEAILHSLYGLYDAHAHGHDFDPARHVDARALMTPSLARAYAKVTKAAKGDAPALDWDLFVDAQDYDVQHLNVTAVAAGKDETVTATFDNLGQPTTVVYDFARTPQGWRIGDVRYPPDKYFPKGFSLLAFARKAG